MDKFMKRKWRWSSVANFFLFGRYPETLCSRAYRLRHIWWFGMWNRWWNYVADNPKHTEASYRFWRRYFAMKGRRK